MIRFLLKLILGILDVFLGFWFRLLFTRNKY